MNTLSPLERGEPVPASIRLNAFGCRNRSGCPTPDLCTVLCLASPPGTPMAKAAPVDLTELETALTRNRLDEIAEKVCALTYGEMIELAEAIWKAKGEAEITQATLPAVIHQWSGSRQ